MQTVYQFFRLVRLSNLLVVVLTMSFFYGLLSNYHVARQYWSLEAALGYIKSDFSFLEHIGWYDMNFVLLMISVILVAASGNIINDYFDQKADRVNKPNRVIIDKYIKRRWAIILNWTFNGIALLIALYLSYKLGNWWITVISFLSINLLYFYSAVYKRKFLIGNLIVAFLTALVPLQVFIYGAFSAFKVDSPFGLNDDIFVWDNLLAIAIYCGFAFLLNFVREVIKDMADVKGDLLIQSRSIPIRLGFKRTKYVLAPLYLLTLAPLVYFAFFGGSFGRRMEDSDFIYFPYLIHGVAVFVLISGFIVFNFNKPKYYLLASNFIKIALLFGVISALFYAS